MKRRCETCKHFQEKGIQQGYGLCKNRKSTVEHDKVTKNDVCVCWEGRTNE